MLQRLKCARFSLCYQRKNAGAKRESDKRKFLENQAECWRGGVLERWCYRLKVAGCRFKAAQRPEVQEQQQKRQGDEHRLAQEPQCEKKQCENVKEPRLPSPKHISQNALFPVFRVFRGSSFGFRISLALDLPPSTRIRHMPTNKAGRKTCLRLLCVRPPMPPIQPARDAAQTKLQEKRLATGPS